MLFGWKKRDGLRRFRTSYLEVARKNGKTTVAAAIGLYLFFADNEAGAHVYTAATKYDQARISHGEATRMVKGSSDLKRHISVFKNNLSIEATGSKFEPLGSDSTKQDGLNVHGAILDELHAWPDRDLFDVLVTATASRRQPLIFVITTAGYDRHTICWEQHEYTEKVLSGHIKDNSHFGIIYALDKEDNWEDEEVWTKANPNLGISVKIDDLRDKATKAKEIPAQLNSFRRLHLNTWTESITKWISNDQWDACNWSFDAEELTSKVCYAGLDLSSTHDLTAFVLVFPPKDEDDKYKILCRFWIPADNIHVRVRRDRVPYDVWVNEGYINATPGNIIDYGYILRQINEDADKYDLKEICFDRWGSTKIIQDLDNMGYTRDGTEYERHLIDFGQGYASMSPAVKETEKLILNKELAHNNNPVLRWMIGNVVIKQDPAGNMKLDKSKSVERIDGVTALVMAISRAVVKKDNSSPYDGRGILVL